MKTMTTTAGVPEADAPGRVRAAHERPDAGSRPPHGAAAAPARVWR
ncbi:hypothetical protein ACWCP6_18335 [Streptomyces sp. NPDC002004]